MLFSSLTFLLYFLPAVPVIHYFLPQKLQNLFLFIASLFFYAWGEARYMPLILVLMGLNYGLSRGLADHKYRKLFMILGVILNIGTLGFYKYTGFLFSMVGLGAYAPQVTLPLGISFFTFQTLGYLIDVYRHETPEERNFIDFGCFIMLFPQLIAGPIIRYGDLREALHRYRRPQGAELERGMTRFILGLSAKVLLANALGEIWETLGNGTSGMICAWLGIIGFALQIYFDFYGYSLMAIGIGDMVGLTIADNFNRPYTAVSITDFWRRWHMTLSYWFRDYVYIPLGGNRRGMKRQILNLLAVWALTGLWHGASWNFVLWGLYYFVLLMLEKFVLSPMLSRHRIISHVYTLILVLFGWAIFALDDLSLLPGFTGALFSFRQGGEILFYLRQYGVVLVAAILVNLPPVLDQSKRILKKYPVVNTVLMLLLLVLCLCRLVNSSYNPFLYFRF